MTSDAFDPYVILRPPSCADAAGACDGQSDNDDFLAGGGAYVWRRADEGGRWSVLATSSAPGETGDYEVRYRVAGEGARPATAGVTLDAARTERGALGPGDETLESGEYADSFSFVGRAGDRLTADLRSTAFDPYLILQMPNDEQLDNDDWEGSQEHARLEAELPVDGAYRLLVTTYSVGEAGSYTLELTPGGSGGTPDAAAPVPGDTAPDPFEKD